MNRTLLLGPLLSFLLFTSTPISAMTIYDVNRPVGLGGVIGTITTDSTFGVLGVSNFIDWNLTLDNGVETFLLTGANSGVGIIGEAVFASSTALWFDFSIESSVPANPSLLFQFEGAGSGKSSWCFNSDSCSLVPPLGGEKVYIGEPGSGPGSAYAVYWDPIQQIGTSVPLPGTVWLLGAGLAILAAQSRRISNG